MARRHTADELRATVAALPPDERAGFLDARCGDDPDLRAEVESLLAMSARAETLVRDPSPTDGLEGRRIGRFTVRSRIAVGGMGAVYEAEQESPRRTVALKVLRDGLCSPTALRRFEYEAQVLAQLRHPCIAQIYEAGTHDGGAGPVPYFAMEYIPRARTLTAYAADARLGTRQRLDLFVRVCEAVQHAHARGIIHRDLKPSNILVDPSGHPRVIDFGVAKSADRGATTLRTDMGQLVGTLQYMSPEQCDADPSDLDIRSDVYSLGVLLYELLTGRAPYELGPSVVHATRVIREQAPVRPGTVDDSLRGDLETIVLKAMEKDRDRRYRSAGEFADDIGRLLRAEPILARPATLRYQLRVFVRAHRGPVAAAAAFIGLLAVFGASMAVLYAHARAAQREAAIARDQARAEGEQLRAERRAAETVQRFVMRLNEHMMAARNSGYDPERVIRVHERLARAELADDPEGWAGALLALRRTADRQRMGPLADELAIAAADQLGRLPPGPRLIRLALDVAGALIDAGEPARAERELERLLGRPPSVQDGWLLQMIARARLERGDAPGAREALDRACTAFAPPGERPPPDFVRALRERAALLRRTGDAPAAVAALEQADAARPVSQQPGPERADLLRDLGDALLDAGDAARAVAVLEEARRLAIETYADQSWPGLAAITAALERARAANAPGG